MDNQPSGSEEVKEVEQEAQNGLDLVNLVLSSKTFRSIGMGIASLVMMVTPLGEAEANRIGLGAVMALVLGYLAYRHYERKKSGKM